MSRRCKPTGRPRCTRTRTGCASGARRKITLEGHCDSRGTTEYNLALGERRAQAAKAYLVSLGISADRILTISKGKESPFCTEEAESCWSQNRRGHFVITAK